MPPQPTIATFTFLSTKNVLLVLILTAGPRSLGPGFSNDFGQDYGLCPLRSPGQALSFCKVITFLFFLLSGTIFPFIPVIRIRHAFTLKFTFANSRLHA